MKGVIKTILAVTFLSQNLSGQDLDCRVVLVKREPLISNYITGKPLTKDDSTYVTLLQGDRNLVDSKGETEFDHSSARGHSIIIQFYDQSNNLMTNGDVGINSITMTEISTGESYTVPNTSFDLASRYILVKLKDYLNNKPKNREKIRLSVKTNNDTTYTRYFKYINGWQPYNFADNIFGLWFPVNMYSTSFERSKNGVLFTAMPIGLALGGKYNISQDFYLGLSATLNYTVAEASDSSAKSYFLQDFAVGPLIDISGYAYIGYTYPINLTSEASTLKPQFVIGFGVKLTKLLEGI